MKAMNSNTDGSVTGFMCATAWECELGAASAGNRIFPSLDDAKKSLKCASDCGIVEVRVTFVSQPMRGDWPEDEEAARDAIAELSPLIEQAFRDGVAYGTNVQSADVDLAWEHSSIRAALKEGGHLE